MSDRQKEVLDVYNGGSEEVKVALTKLFPEVIGIGDQTYIKMDSPAMDITNNCELLNIRLSGEFSKKSFCLSRVYDWEIKADNEGFLVLVPRRRIN